MAGTDAFVVEFYADFGSSAPWVARTVLQAQTLVNAVPAFGTTRDAFHVEMGETFASLGIAFNALRDLRGAVERGAPGLEIQGAYENFYGSLWAAYKDRFQSALAALGYELGFVWQADAGFEKEAVALVAARPEFATLIDLIRRYRAEFQNPLAVYRNDWLEHRKPADSRMLASFHNLDSAEDTFDRVWRAMEAIIAGLAVVELPAFMVIVEIPEAQRDPGRPERLRPTIRSGSLPVG